jgi:PKD repeat protein
MKKVSLILYVIGLLVTNCFSQGSPQNWNWYFGDSAAINFSSGSPVAVSGSKILQLEGCATISDTSGNLLFYTDGISVWNKNNIVMSHGTGLYGQYSTTQSALIVPKPDSSAIYYIFTADVQSHPHGINYSEVDMTLNGDLGDITVKNVQLVTPACEKLCVVKHCNGIDYWMIAHGFLDSSYYSYQVTSAGVLAPVISNIGLYIDTTDYSINTTGYLKASPNGRKIAAAIAFEYHALVQLFDFDNSSGILSNCISITNMGDDAYGISFSPDNTKLYTGNTILCQYDISSNNQTAISASQYVIDSTYFGWAMQLGPDNKLYLTQAQTHYLDVINNPNVSGAGCNYVMDAVDLGTGVCEAGLPNFIDAYNPLPPAPPVSAFRIDTLSGCKPLTIHLTNNSIRATSYLWIFSDGGTDTAVNPTHVYNTSGLDSITLIAYYTTPCGVFSDTSIQSFYFNVFDPPTQPVITLSNDTLYSSSLIDNQWFLNDTLLSGDTNSYYVPSINGNYTVEVMDSNGCTSTSTIYLLNTGINEIFYPSSHTFIYPNPNDGSFTLNSDLPSSLFQIKDVFGRVVYSLNVKGIQAIDVSTLAKGIYYWEVVSVPIESGGISGMGKLAIMK